MFVLNVKPTIAGLIVSTELIACVTRAEVASIYVVAYLGTVSIQSCTFIYICTMMQCIDQLR